MHDFPTSLEPVPGGLSGETFLASAATEDVVLRIYGPHSAPRGPLAPEIDAAVLELVGPLVPVPRVLEVRRGDPGADLPGLLVTSRLAGERLDELLRRLDDEQVEAVGRRLGTLVARLGHMVQPRRGGFADGRLVPEGADRAVPDTGTAGGPSEEEVAEAQDLVDEDRRAVLVHGDLVLRHVRIDPGTLEVTGVAGWGHAHSGSPWTDLGSLLREGADRPVLGEAIVAGYRALMPSTPGDLVARARAADLVATAKLPA